MESRRRFRRREDEDDEEKIRVAKTVTEKQRLRLEKLLKNIDKPIVIPESKKDLKPAPPPEFVRNVVGSSAGAGSGEYHIYRNLRKKEYARQRFYEEETKKETLDKEFEEKLEEKKKAAEEKTAKKRAKRLKRKQKLKNAKKQKTDKQKEKEDEDSEEESESESEGEPGQKSDVETADK